jgi:hypothetical protein
MADMGAGFGMLIVEAIAKIRRAYFAQECTARGFWDTGLKSTLPERAVEVAVCDTQPG